MENIEIKTPLEDRAAAERRLRALGAREMGAIGQRDTFFDVPRGWLKLREQEGRPPELIAYLRSTQDAGPRPSQYDVRILDDAPSWKRLLGRVLPVDGVVEKTRTLWIHGHTRIHLDRVAGLGEFLELETMVEGITLQEAQAEAGRLVEALGLDRGAFLSRPYRDLLRERAWPTGPFPICPGGVGKDPE